MARQSFQTDSFWREKTLEISFHHPRNISCHTTHLHSSMSASASTVTYRMAYTLATPSCRRWCASCLCPDLHQRKIALRSRTVACCQCPRHVAMSSKTPLGSVGTPWYQSPPDLHPLQELWVKNRNRFESSKPQQTLVISKFQHSNLCEY